MKTIEQWKKRPLLVLGDIGDETLASYVGIIVKYDKSL